MGVEKPKEFPVGTGEKFQEERGKERLPALEVANTVLWVNPAFPELPLRLKEGQPTNLAMLFTNKLPPPPLELPRWKKVLGYSQPQPKKVHFPVIMPEFSARSGLEGSVIFRDLEGRLYRDIDIKGLGFFGSGKVKRIYPKEGKEKEAWGLHDYRYAEQDRRYSEQFLEAGIRTHRIVAVIDLKEIIDSGGKEMSIERAKKNGIIPFEMEPVLEVRAFGTKERIEYLGSYSASTRARKVLALEDAKTMVAQELGIEREKFSYEEYLRWFAQNLGEGVAKIRKLGLFHSYLSGHNITLDCRIVDLDSVAPLHIWREDATHPEYKNVSNEYFYKKDSEYALNTFYDLFYDVEDLTGIAHNKEELAKLYKAAYDEELKRYEIEG